MNLTEKQQAGKDVMNNIIIKCWEDESFKAQLLADPISTIEKFTGKPTNIPEGKRLVVVDQASSSDAVYFNIPAKPEMADFANVELTDEQLEMVAGGGSGDWTLTWEIAKIIVKHALGL
jgi:hypothetical protein